ncbi:unnamed protein product [Soboliphyme baturini]|uniref:Uncharacterized protein n=1 Tax=Soboliphyme baturini TaxID=241478 RepID=A0A183ICG1_9BILA|nr:unnamed protein product [Soboliphyme baturini]
MTKRDRFGYEDDVDDDEQSGGQVLHEGGRSLGRSIVAQSLLHNACLAVVKQGTQINSAPLTAARLDFN